MIRWLALLLAVLIILSLLTGDATLALAAGAPVRTAAELADHGAPEVTVGSGRGRPSAFVPGDPHHGVRVEVTQAEDDVQS